MAKLWITEYTELPRDAGLATPQIASTPSITTQVVTFTTSTQSAAFNASTKFVRIISDANCHLLFGANPTATTSSMRMVADAAEYFGVVAGQKVAAVTA
jgi:hypothetical protein